jgi:polyhydroxyalkanoate depolymerase
MSAAKHPARPKTLTMMGGPIDTREAPTAVNTLATQRPHSWFQRNVIATVPYSYPGAGRAVYPGFLQLAGFMTMNLGSHLTSHWEMFKHLVAGDGESAESTKDFYDEYRAVCDMTTEFYLQTVDAVFQRHLLPKGELMHRGRRSIRQRSRISQSWRLKASATTFPDRPDQGRARHLDRPAGRAQAVSPRQGCRPLRHLQRQQMA